MLRVLQTFDENVQALSALTTQLKQYQSSFPSSQRKIASVVEGMFVEIYQNSQALIQASESHQSFLETYIVKNCQLSAILEKQSEILKKQIQNVQEEIETEKKAPPPQDNSLYSALKKRWGRRKEPLQILQERESDLQKKDSTIQEQITEIETENKVIKDKITKPQKSLNDSEQKATHDELLKTDNEPPEETSVSQEQKLQEQMQKLQRESAQLEKELAELKNSIAQDSKAIDPSELSKAFQELPTTEQVTTLETTYQTFEQTKTDLLTQLVSISKKLVPDSKDSTPESIVMAFTSRMNEFFDQTKLTQSNATTLVARSSDLKKNIETLLSTIQSHVKQLMELSQLETSIPDLIKKLSKAPITTGAEIQKILEDTSFANILSPPEQEFERYPQAISDAPLDPVQKQDHYKSVRRLQKTLENTRATAHEHYQRYFQSLVEIIGRTVEESKEIDSQELETQFEQLISYQTLISKVQETLNTIPKKSSRALSKQKQPKLPAKKPLIISLERKASSIDLSENQLGLLKQTLTKQYQQFSQVFDVESKDIEEQDESIESIKQKIIQNYCDILNYYDNHQPVVNDTELEIIELKNTLSTLSAEQDSTLLLTQLESFAKDISLFTQRYELARDLAEKITQKKQTLLDTLISANEKLLANLETNSSGLEFMPRGLTSNIEDARRELQPLSLSTSTVEAQIQAQTKLSEKLKDYQSALIDTIINWCQLELQTLNLHNSSHNEPIQNLNARLATIDPRNPTASLSALKEIKEATELLKQELEQRKEKIATIRIQLNTLKLTNEQLANTLLSNLSDLKGQHSIFESKVRSAVSEYRAGNLTPTDDLENLKAQVEVQKTQKRVFEAHQAQLDNLRTAQAASSDSSQPQSSPVVMARLLQQRGQCDPEEKIDQSDTAQAKKILQDLRAYLNRQKTEDEKGDDSLNIHSLAIETIRELENSKELDLDAKVESQNKAHEILQQGLAKLNNTLATHPDEASKGKQAIKELHEKFTSIKSKVSTEQSSWASISSDATRIKICQLVAQKVLYNFATEALNQSKQIASQRQKATGANIKYSFIDGLQKLIKLFGDLARFIARRAPKEECQPSGKRRLSIYQSIQQDAKTAVDEATQAMDTSQQINLQS